MAIIAAFGVGFKHILMGNFIPVRAIFREQIRESRFLPNGWAAERREKLKRTAREYERRFLRGCANERRCYENTIRGYMHQV
jgi:hypothetical protein